MDKTAIGVRIPNNAAVLSILTAIDRPIVATSVNISGERPASKASAINSEILKNVDIVVRGDGICCGVPSAVLDLRTAEQKIIR